MDIGGKLDGINTALEKGIDVELKYPGTNKPIGITIRTASYDSERARVWQRQRSNERMKNPAAKMTAEETETENRAFAVAMLLGWTWGQTPNDDGEMEDVTIDGRKWDFSTATADQFFRRFPHLGAQVSIAANDVSRFTQA